MDGRPACCSLHQDVLTDRAADHEGGTDTDDIFGFEAHDRDSLDHDVEQPAGTETPVADQDEDVVCIVSRVVVCLMSDCTWCSDSDRAHCGVKLPCMSPAPTCQHMQSYIEPNTLRPHIVQASD